MRCPKCGCMEDRVIDSRIARDGNAIRRRRECLRCHHRFTTYETIERHPLLVIKRDGRREPFQREKLRNGILRACEKRPIGPRQIDEVVERIEMELHDEFESEVPYREIGERVMRELRLLDPVAYVRFASVYRRFEEVDEFIQAIKRLEIPYDTATYRLPGF